jgi:hypothetical protein
VTNSRSYLQPFLDELVAAEKALDESYDRVDRPKWLFLDAAYHARLYAELDSAKERVSAARRRYEDAAARESALKGN